MVKFIKFGKKKIPFRLTFYVLKVFNSLTGKKIEYINESKSYTDLSIILEYSIKEGCNYLHSNYIYNDDILIILESEYKQIIELIYSFFPTKKDIDKQDKKQDNNVIIKKNVEEMNYDKMYGLISSKFNFTISDFDNLTPIELHYLIYSYYKEKENDIKENYNIMRLQTHYLFKLHLGRKSPYKRPIDLMPFVWDEKEPTEIIIPTAEKWKELESISKKAIENYNKQIKK